ncbi:efflux transporter outer membrane subunit [Paraburkholderia rhizosphaerae]|nr:efflux transporter outer membrane subunit [Paraburkholderia rhizosphaerae]
MMSGCVAVGPDYVIPDAKMEQSWLGTLDTQERSRSCSLLWWESFGDPVLVDLVKHARENSPTLESAAVRIAQAAAQLAGSASTEYLQSGKLSAGGKQIHHTKIGPFPEGTQQSAFGQGTASWEIDFWGKYRRQIEADRANVHATEAAYDDALVSLTGQVASTYIDLRVSEARLSIARQNTELQRSEAAIASAQHQLGETSELAAAQAATLLAQTESQIPPLERMRAQDRDQLALLIGTTPTEIDGIVKATGVVPVPPHAIDAGIPRDLLRRRPDVRQAAFDAAQQSALIGVTKAQLYPSFSLSGIFDVSSGYSHATDPFALGSAGFSVLAGTLTLPVFNRGQLTSQVRVQDAQFESAVLNYRNVVLQAQQEVEDGLAGFSSTSDALRPLQRAVLTATRALELATRQYSAGEVAYQSVLDSQRSLSQDKDSLAQGQGALAQAAVSLYRALGGGWERTVDDIPISEEIRTSMSARTSWGGLLDKTHEAALAR